MDDQLFWKEIERKISLKSLKNFSGDDKVIMHKMLKGFINYFPVQLSDLEKALLEGGSEELSKAIHTIKPSVRMYTNEVLIEYFEVFSKDVKDNPVNAVEQFIQLKEGLNQIVDHVQNTLQTYSL